MSGASWFNDSKGTNVGSNVAAIKGLSDGAKGRLVLIAGGDGKGADFTELKSALEGRVTKAVLYGRDAKILADALQGVAALSIVETMQQAVEMLRGEVKDGDVVLFSPACASFDQFKNYEDRGRQFVAAVRAEEGA